MPAGRCVRRKGASGGGGGIMGYFFPTGLRTSILLFCLQTTLSAKFSVLGPDQPVIAIYGEDVVLWCSLSPAVSAERMEVRWFRSSFYSPVHLYRDGKDENDQQLKEYYGRTTLLTDNIHNGSVGLRISHVQISDEGQYKCFFEEQKIYEEAILDLKVAGFGSPIHIHLDQQQEGGIRVMCQSAGWYPVPQIHWRGDDGQNVSSTSTLRHSKENGLYSVEDVLIIMQPAGRKLYCIIRNPLMDQAKVATISIAEPFFPKTSPWMVAFSFMLTALLLFALAVYWYFRKQRQEKEVLSSKLETLSAEVELRTAAMRPVLVELDERTVHNSLTITLDRRRVTHADEPQDLLNNTERFDTETCVLGIQRFTHGRHYWKVDVGNGREWAVGVCRESVRRTGAYQFSPEEGIWCIALFVDRFQALASPEVKLPYNIPRTIGVYLEHEAGKLSFYDGDSMDAFYTFSECFFVGTVRPFFWIGTTGIEIVMCH